MKSKNLIKFFHEEIILNIIIILLFLFFFPFSVLLKIFKVNLLGLNNKDNQAPLKRLVEKFIINSLHILAANSANKNYGGFGEDILSTQTFAKKCSLKMI